MAGAQRTCVLFNESAPVIIAGDSSGGVSVFRMFDVGQKIGAAEQKQRLAAAMDANIMTESLKAAPEAAS